jgi:hypothetical protein
MSVQASTDLAAFRQFRPAGPVAASFLNDRVSDARFIRGPVGGGKTVSCIFDCLANAMAMPVCTDGWIHFRVAVIGTTYGQLERNLYPTWQFWLPKDGGQWTEGEWTGGGGRFAIQVLKFWTIRGNHKIPVRFEAIFGAIGELAVEVFVRGFEPTAWYLYEIDQLPKGIVEQCLGRLRRWPNRELLGRQPDYRSYLIGDLNSPDIDSWYHELLWEIRPPGYREFPQPSGLSPRAENLQNLAGGYYQKLYELNKHNTRWVKRMILNQFAPSSAGDPVYEEWSDDLHYAAQPIPYDPRRPLLLFFDQGLTQPAGLAVQRAANGQWRVLLEFVPGRMSARRFAKGFKDLIGERFPGARLSHGWADPAGFGGVDKQDGELGWAEIVSAEMGIEILPAPTQEIDLRLQAVKDELTFMVDGNTPALSVSPWCPMLRKGFASHYMFEKRRVEQSQSRVPIKNVYANPQDALQYGLLGEKGRYGVISGSRAAGADAAFAAAGNVKIRSDFMAGW